MLDEELNKRIIEAAEQYHPAYDDEAWSMMEKMLAEHLPQKKEAGRKMFFLLFTTILIVGSLFIFYQQQQHVPAHLSLPFSINSTKKILEKNGVKSSYITKNKRASTAAVVDKIALVNEQKLRISVLDKNARNKKLVFAKKNDDNAGNKNITKEISNEVKDANDGSGKMMQTTETEKSDKAVSVSNEKENHKTVTVKDDNEKNKPLAITEKSKPAAPVRTSKSFAGRLGITVSAGPDVSGLSIQKAGKLKIGYGAGLSFDLSPKLTLRSGFYVASKVYHVGANDYHAQASSQFNYTYLQGIGADCKIYEIPLILNYNFGKAKNHGWFVAAGLSSYLMKRESYVYYYKYPSGNTYDEHSSITNKNKHYFSVLDLSAGYYYNVNKRFSVAAEPYLKLPLSGVGAGKIKLNSGGILFTITMKPFKK